eukprot:3857653-Rhodomonas_salina.2
MPSRAKSNVENPTPVHLVPETRRFAFDFAAEGAGADLNRRPHLARPESRPGRSSIAYLSTGHRVARA